MSRKWTGAHHTTRQKGKSRRGTKVGTYAQLNKGRHADRYDRPYVDGSYRNWPWRRSTTLTLEDGW